MVSKNNDKGTPEQVSNSSAVSDVEDPKRVADEIVSRMKEAGFGDDARFTDELVTRVLALDEPYQTDFHHALLCLGNRLVGLRPPIRLKRTDGGA